MDALDTFLDWFWVLIYIFLFFAYLIILWQILTDLFSDHKLSGWWKAVWIIFLVVFPFLTALVYVIARGKGMAQRQRAAVAEAKQETDEYIRQVANPSPADHIARAKQLLDDGAITPEEYETLKAKALAS